jgi:hypothetical protein
MWNMFFSKLCWIFDFSCFARRHWKFEQCLFMMLFFIFSEIEWKVRKSQFLQSTWKRLKYFFIVSCHSIQKFFFLIRLFHINMLCFVNFASLSCFQEVFSTNHFWKFNFVFKMNITKLSSRIRINVLKKNLAIRRNDLMLNDSQEKKKILFWTSFKWAISTMLFSSFSAN